MTGVTACHTIDVFTDAVSRAPGLSFRDVDPLTTLIVHTRNSCYRIVTSGDGSVIVQGGSFFPNATSARIEGSGFGGSLLKVAWIGIGLRMEIIANGQRIITSPVRNISIESRGSALLH